MRWTTRTLLGLGSCALLSVAGCFKLARTSPPLEEFVLGGGRVVTRAAASAVRDSAGLTIGMRRVDLASYLATPAIVVRRGGRVMTSEFHRWGEDPGAGVTRALSEYLGAAAPVFAVDVAPWPVRSRHDFVVQLRVLRMEGVVPDDASVTRGELHLVASWEVIRPEDGALLARGESDRRQGGWTLGDYHGLVILLEHGLNALAGDVAACLLRLSPAMPPLDAAAGGRTVRCGQTDVPIAKPDRL